MRPPAWAVVSAVAALVGLLGGWVTSGLLQPAGYDPVRMTISALAAGDARHPWIMTSGLYLIGVGHLATAAGLTPMRLPARVLLALGGVAGLGVAGCPQPAHGSADAHLAFTVLGLLALAVFPSAVFRRHPAPWPLRPRDAVGSGVLSLVLLGWVLEAIHGSTLGLAERAITFQQTQWPLLVVLTLRRQLRTPGASLSSDEVATIPV